MNPIETTIDTSKRKLEIRCTSAGASQFVNNSSVTIRDSVIAPTVYGDKAMIKYVIGASNNIEPQSVLKKSTINQTAAVAVSSVATILTSNSIAKAVARPDAIAAVKIQQPSVASALGGECKQQIAIATERATTTGQSLIKLPTIKNLQSLSEKAPYKTIKRPLPPSQDSHSQLTAKRSLGMQSTTQRHIIYKTKNGHSTSAYSEMIASSLLTKSNELPIKKLPTIKDRQRPVQKRLEMKPLIIRGRHNSESSSAAEVTQISSTVTLTKAAITTGKQAKSLPSPLVTIEKKGTTSTSTSSLFNCSKQGKILFPNSAEPMDIVVNTIGGSKMISLGNDLDESVPETGQKSLLIKQCSPTNNEKTPSKAIILKPKQQSLLKVNSLARLLHTSPRTKRSKSLTAIGTTGKRSKRTSAKGRRLSAASEGDVSLQKSMEKVTSDPLETKEVVSPSAPQTTSDSLLCNEQIETVPSSSSNSSMEAVPKKEPNQAVDIVNSFQLNTVLEMLSAFNMLSWRDRIGSCKNSKLKFHLNEFNLLQIVEKCPPRERIHTAYEKPIYERESSSNTSDYHDPLYLCRRCNCRGAAIDFLAPEFCSYECFRHESRKRSRSSGSSIDKLAKDRIKKAKKSYGCEQTIGGTRTESVVECLIPKRYFAWDSYLTSYGAQPAPIDLFLNPFPCGANLFEVGMKLEAIDPEHNSLFCVCTVVEKKGYRLKLKFDGYSKIYNFWVNADSMDIFPPGWCAKTNRVLQPPKGMNLITFNWPTYLNKTKSSPAPRGLFTHLNSSSSTNPFKVGMRLEADDLKNTGKVCVATIADVLDNRVLVHFDGWDESYDYWIDINSPYIHPVDWHQAKSLELVPPPDWEECFAWSEYLEFTQSKPAMPSMFSRRYPIEFSTGMKLEVVDVKNPCLIRPATVLCRDDYKVLLHLDGWPAELTFWVNDDSPDIHPIGWSDETGHKLEPPPGFDRPPADISDKPDMPCPIKGCRGIGNAKRLDINFHANEDTCPYTAKNWEKEIEKQSRLEEVGRFVYTIDPSTNQRRSLSEKTIIDISSDDQMPYVKKEPDVKLPLAGQQKLTQQDCKPKKTSVSDESSLSHSTSFTQEIKLAREYLCDYGPRLRQNYIIWRENSNFNPDVIKKNPLEWTTKETACYITAKCHPVGYLFEREDIDGIALLSMQQSDLTDILKIKLGPAIKIFSHILHLRNQVVSRFSSTKPSTDT